MRKLLLIVLAVLLCSVALPKAHAQSSNDHELIATDDPLEELLQRRAELTQKATTLMKIHVTDSKMDSQEKAKAELAIEAAQQMFDLAVLEEGTMQNVSSAKEWEEWYLTAQKRTLEENLIELGSEIKQLARDTEALYLKTKREFDATANRSSCEEGDAGASLLPNTPESREDLKFSQWYKRADNNNFGYHPTGQNLSPRGYLSVDITDTNLSKVLAILSESSGKDLIMDKDLIGQKVTYRSINRHWSSMLTELSKLVGFEWQENKKGQLKVTHSGEEENSAANTLGSRETVRGGRWHQFVDGTVGYRPVRQEASPGKLFSVDFLNSSLTNVLAVVSEVSGKRIIVERDIVKQKVTLLSYDKNWSTVLTEIADIVGFEWREDENGQLRITH